MEMLADGGAMTSMSDSIGEHDGSLTGTVGTALYVCPEMMKDNTRYNQVRMDIVFIFWICIALQKFES